MAPSVTTSSSSSDAACRTHSSSSASLSRLRQGSVGMVADPRIAKSRPRRGGALEGTFAPRAFAGRPARSNCNHTSVWFCRRAAGHVWPMQPHSRWRAPPSSEQRPKFQKFEFAGGESETMKCLLDDDCSKLESFSREKMFVPPLSFKENGCPRPKLLVGMSLSF